MKKTLFLLLSLLCLLFTNTFSEGTYAFLSACDTKANLIGIGYNDSNVEENFPSPSPVVPSQTNQYTKIVSVKNNQSVPCYIRVFVGFSNNHIGDHVHYVNLNTTDWIYISPTENAKLGGYFYYKNPVMSGTTTKPLFEGIEISSSWDDSGYIQGDAFQLLVYEESVQKGTHSDYKNAWNEFLRV